jgi:anhydro-N-acetylmuramic acid kinase
MSACFRNLWPGYPNIKDSMDRPDQHIYRITGLQWPVHAIGLMSGTSLDGLDICAVRFEQDGSWEIVAFETASYAEDLKTALQDARALSGLALTELHFRFGRFQAERVLEFCARHAFTPDYVAAHGHTVFHQPAKGYSLQIGEGETMAALLKSTVINDFRIRDIATGGQGAPLVPAGEVALFPQYSAFLNLGGIANIHIVDTAAYDVCPCNMLLNDWISGMGLAYDAEGQLAASGHLIPELLDALNGIDWYTLPAPKSLGAEWYADHIPKVYAGYQAHPLADLLHTACHHIAQQICVAIPADCQQVLVTGGGAYHDFLMQCLRFYRPNTEWVIPDARVVESKEALVFAWLGLRVLEGKGNVLHRLTGGAAGLVAGSVHLY